MTSEEMTVHKALCELKTLDSRISAKIAAMTFSFPNKHSNDKYSGVPVKECCDEIKSEYRSICDLVSRRDAIKRAVVRSNAETGVVCDGREYTVAEAIDMKNNTIPLIQKLLEKIDRDYATAKNKAAEYNDNAVEDRADEYIKALYGNTDMKSASEEVKKARADFVAAQSYDVVDPIGSVAEMEKLRNRIDGFMTEIDSSLSVSNAITMIAIEY